MVKKKSDMLVKANNKEVEIASDVEMDPGFWRDTMDLYFIQDKESRGLQQDNLIFFVNKIGMQGHGSNAGKEVTLATRRMMKNIATPTSLDSCWKSTILM
ncbi:hypothetical protein T459_23770 [Capsicum annuum]|uniref:Uncharacterized protein n=1 Tax=Capsicum annuum TaxID=4072 RepID=A0A2G2YTK6_CAPAN|nr:hypothetical protein FXO37_04851 [Capsicum annuum]PHT72985.1 hypothetical protein T459_23770 [Capsicum annuum]